jgi:hypothetical protein
MKTLLALFTVALLAFAMPVQAQNAGTWSGLISTTVGGSGQGGTNAIVANTTNTMAIRLDCPRTENITLFASFKLISGSGTSDVEFRLAPGHESGYATNTAFTHKWNIPANGTTGVAAMTNINVAGIPYLWVISQGHNNTTAVTNLAFSYGFKR